MPDNDPLNNAIAAHLATRDIPCPNCNYNLKGLVKPQCPECARRITPEDIALPEPELPKTERLVRYLAGRNIKCKCGYNLRGLTTNQCPECARTFELMGGRRFAVRKRHRRLSPAGCFHAVLFLLALILILVILIRVLVSTLI